MLPTDQTNISRHVIVVARYLLSNDTKQVITCGSVKKQKMVGCGRCRKLRKQSGGKCVSILIEGNSPLLAATHEQNKKEREGKMSASTSSSNSSLMRISKDAQRARKGTKTKTIDDVLPTDVLMRIFQFFFPEHLYHVAKVFYKDWIFLCFGCVFLRYIAHHSLSSLLGE